MPRLPKGKKNPSDDDPFWDSWDEDEPIAKENRAPLRRTNNKKKSSTSNAAAAAAYDPFGRDGFGDDWDYKPSAKFDTDDHDDPVPQEEFSSAECDWGTSRSRKQTEEIKRKSEREEQLSRLKKKNEAAAKAVAAAEAAAAEAAEAEAAAKTVAEEKWQFKVNQATDCIALADPAQALSILYSLSLDVDITKFIDQKKMREVSQLYAAICDRQQLAFRNETCSSYHVDQSSSEINESCSDEYTIGGDTVEAKHCNAAEEDEGSELLCDRLPSQLSKTSESNCDESTVGGDTVKVNRSDTEGTDEIDTGSATVVVDRSLTHSSIILPRIETNKKHSIEKQYYRRRRSRRS